MCWTFVPLTGEERDARIGPVPAGGFDAEKDDRAFARAYLADASAVARLPHRARRRPQRLRHRFVRRELAQPAPARELTHQLDRFDDVVERDPGAVGAGG